ncbi:MAG: ATP-binding protein [Patescibacteria group bacterium]
MQLPQYKKLFIAETRVKLKEFEDLLVLLEKDPAHASVIEKALMVLHSLKSYAATMSYLHLANAVHLVEEAFIRVKNRERKLSPSDIDSLFVVVDAFRSNLASIQQSNTEIDLGSATAFIMREGTPAPAPAAVAKKAIVAPVQDTQYEPLGSYVEVPTNELDAELDLVNDIVSINQQMLRLSQHDDMGGVKIAIHNLEARVSELRQSLISMKMIPVRQYFVFLSRLVRDIARQNRVFIKFELRDNNLRFERNVLDSLREICVQLVKNAVAHGFREGDRGTVRLIFEFKSGVIHMSVSDSGRGIDWGALSRRARSQHLLSRTTRLTPDAKFRILFEYGVSSKEVTTLVAGRGVGLPLVYSHVRTLQGSIAYSSESSGRKRGAHFEITIPLTPTLFRALTWHWGSYYFAIPLFVVDNVIQLHEGKPQPKRTTIRYKGSTVRFCDFQKLLGMAIPDADTVAAEAVALIRVESKRVALRLPVGVTEQELIIEFLPSLKRFPLVAGVAVAEDSAPVVVLNHRALFAGSTHE